MCDFMVVVVGIGFGLFIGLCVGLVIVWMLGVML